MWNWIKRRVELTPERMLTKLRDEAERSRIEHLSSVEFSLAMVSMLEGRIAWVKTELAALHASTSTVEPIKSDFKPGLTS